MAAARKRRAHKPARKVARRKPRRTITTTTTTKVVRSNPRRRARRNPDWGANVKHWTPARRAAWRRTSEAAKFRTFKMGEIIDRRRAVHLKRHGSGAPGEALPPKLAARHAAYRRSWDVEMRRQAREAREEKRERRKARRGNPMAKKKRTAAQRRAFRKMLAGLKRHKARKNPGRKKRRGRARRRKNPSTAVATNPRRKRRKSSRGGSIMAKRRRRRTRTNPGRRHHRRRTHHRRHRRRNPGGGGIVSIVKTTIASAIPAMAAGGAMAFVDSKLFKDKAMPVQVVGKLALAAGAGYLLRNRPRTAALVMGAVMGGVAYQLVAQANGGVVAPDQQDAGKKMAALVYANRRMASLVNQNGSLRTQPSLSGMGQGMGDGGTALPTMPIYDPVNLG